MALIRGVAIAAAAAVAAGHVAAQTIRGTILSAAASTPVAHASIRSRATGQVASSDRRGHFVLRQVPVSDTLEITAIGWEPVSVVVTDTTGMLIVRLERTPVVISDLIAVAPAVEILDLSDQARWRMPMAAARTVPPAVEPDIYRALAMIPAVSFSSPLSARPAIRGYDAEEVITRIDGFDVLNLHHLGRVFSSFPADAAEEIAINPAPYSASHGGSIGGIVDVTGRSGREDEHGGASWSFGSLSAYGGGGNSGIRYFAGARLFYWKSLSLIPGVEIPYHFEDLYANASFGPADRPYGRITLFATQDRAGDGKSRNHLDWDNLLLGARWRLLSRGNVSLETATSAARFRQRGEQVPGLHSFGHADLANRFGRLLASMELTVAGTASRFLAGFSIGWRSVVNEIAESVAPGLEPIGLSSFPTTRTSVDRVEMAGWLEWSRRLGALTIGTSTRVDAAGSAVAVQPRIQARWAVSPAVEVRAAAGRLARLYHLLADSRSEPDFDFLDFWVAAGEEIPIGRSDNLTLDVSADLSPFLGRLSGYLSSGRGVGALRPETDQRHGPGDFFRFGRARTRGIEAQLALRGDASSPRSASVSYALSRSERHWGAAWVPWALDRAHQLRAFGQARAGRLSLFAAFDWSSGTPVTPVDFRVSPGPGIPADGGTITSIDPELLVFGSENGAATSGTIRLDGGIALSFGGPDRSRFTLGVSVINLLGTAVAPFGLIGSGTVARDRFGRETDYARLFDLPPIPTLTLRGEF